MGEGIGIGVHWFAPFFSGGGYCSEAISFAVSLHNRGIPIKIEQHGDSFSQNYFNSLPDELVELLVDLKNADISAKPVVTICHSEPGAWHPSRWAATRCPPAASQYRVGRTMFETDRLPDGWAARLNGMDQVWVPTEFSRKIFAAAGVEEEKLAVLGESVDTGYFNPHGVQPYRLQDARPETHIFLSVFKWEERKGWDILVEAYFKEFNSDDDVLLVILTNEYHSRPGFRGFEAEIEDVANQKGLDVTKLPKIKLLTGLSQDDLRALYKAADVFVLPSRGEGWGRPHVEAMAMGLPVIATNWSGPTEYLTDANSYPLKTNELVKLKNGPFKGHFWADPSVSHLTELMREVYKDQKHAAEKGEKARRDMVERFSPDVLGQQVEDLLLEIQDKITLPAPPQTCNLQGDVNGQCSEQPEENLKTSDVSGFIIKLEFIDASLIVLFVYSLIIIFKKLMKKLRSL